MFNHKSVLTKHSRLKNHQATFSFPSNYCSGFFRHSCVDLFLFLFFLAKDFFVTPSLNCFWAKLHPLFIQSLCFHTVSVFSMTSSREGGFYLLHSSMETYLLSGCTLACVLLRYLEFNERDVNVFMWTDFGITVEMHNNKLRCGECAAQSV